MQLKNKNIFVTGSSRGIGLAIAHKFAQLRSEEHTSELQSPATSRMPSSA